MFDFMLLLVCFVYVLWEGSCCISCRGLELKDIPEAKKHQQSKKKENGEEE